MQPWSQKLPQNILRVGNPLTIYRGLSGTPGPKPRKSLKKVSRSKKSFGTFSRLFLDSPDFFETFSRLSGGPGAGGLRRLFFRLFSGFRARRARETPVNGQRVSNLRAINKRIMAQLVSTSCSAHIYTVNSGPVLRAAPLQNETAPKVCIENQARKGT